MAYSAGYRQMLGVQIPEGDAGTAATVDHIRQIVDDGVKSADVHETAIQIVRNVPAHNPLADAKAIFDWVLKNIRYTPDIYNKEALRTPENTLRMRVGDCDDINAILLPTLLASVGLKTQLVTIAASPADPTAFSHIYSEVLVNGRWIALDAARRGAKFGKAPSQYYRKQVWSLFNDGTGVGGLGFNWAALTSALTAGTQGAAQIIQAANPVYPIVPGYSQSAPPGSANVYAGVSSGTPWWEIGLVAVAGLLLVRSFAR